MHDNAMSKRNNSLVSYEANFLGTLCTAIMKPIVCNGQSKVYEDVKQVGISGGYFEEVRQERSASFFLFAFRVSF